MTVLFPDVIIDLHLLFISLYLNSRFQPSSNVARTNPVAATSTSTPSHYLIRYPSLILPSLHFHRSVNGRTGLWQWSTMFGLGLRSTRMLRSGRTTTCPLLRWRRLHLLLWRMLTPSVAPAWGIRCRAENSSRSCENPKGTVQIFRKMCSSLVQNSDFTADIISGRLKNVIKLV